MADALDINAVNDIVRWAVQSINVNEQGQTLTIQGTVQQQQQQQQQPQDLLTSRHVQQFVRLLQEHPRAVDTLFIKSFTVTVRAVEILLAYFPTSVLRHIRFDGVNLRGNANAAWRRLLSGLHGNASVVQLGLFGVDLEGRAGGEVISTLLQHNPHLTILYCGNLQLGVEGARAMQPGLRQNRTLHRLWLDHCQLGDEGVSLIVDVLHGNTTMFALCLNRLGFTANGRPHVTRLLQNNQALRVIYLEHNPGLFDNQKKFRLFSSSLQNSQVALVSLIFCQLPGHVMTTLFEALSTKTTTTESVEVYDNVQLQGADLDSLLEIIPRMRNVRGLSINLDFMNQSVLSSFRRNTKIQHLCTLNEDTSTIREEVTTGPVFDIMTRNRWLLHAFMLIGSDRRLPIPLGLWSKAIERLTCGDNNTGATAVYAIIAIMHEKLIMWWPPQHQTTAAAASMTNAPPAITHSSVASTSVAAIAASNSSSTTTGGGERSSAQDDDDDSTNNNMKTSSSSSTPTSLEPPSNKRARQS